MSGVQLIGKEPEVGFQWTPTPLAHPAVAALNVGHKVVVHQFGGLTRLEQAAITIAAGCVNMPTDKPFKTSDDFARFVVQVAQAVLAAAKEAEPELYQSGT